MKVILAGYSKTGTKSLCAALRQLDYEVYDFMDHFWYHGDQWIRIMNEGSTKEDFKEMYQNIDAITGAPVYRYWKEIHEAFPDAKIILTTRDEDKWHKSFLIQHQQFIKNYKYQIIQVLTPTGRKYFRFYSSIVKKALGIEMRSPFDFSYHLREKSVRQNFRQHFENCVENAPKDKLLVFSVKEGWEPLCRFLEKDVPNKPFPHENVGGTFMNDQMKSHVSLIRMQREMNIGLTLISSLLLVGVYKFLHKWGYLTRFRKIFSLYH